MQLKLFQGQILNNKKEGFIKLNFFRKIIENLINNEK